MSVSVILGLAVLLASVLLSQKIAINARAELDDAVKLSISEAFIKRNFNYTVIVFGLVIAYLAALYAFPRYSSTITLLYGGAFTVYIFLKLILNVRKLNKIGAPPRYISKVIMSFAVFIGGAVAAGLVAAFAGAGFGN